MNTKTTDAKPAAAHTPGPCETCGAIHTSGAMRAAHIIIGEGIDRHGKPSRIKTAFGEKSRCGVADLIDRETAAPDLLAVVQVLFRDVNGLNATQRATSREYAASELCRRLSDTIRQAADVIHKITT